MSMVFQSYAIWPHMTVFENVAYGLRVRKESGATLKEKVHHALEMVKMERYADRNASALSGGQQQRVALARAFALRPTVLLADESTSDLDAANRELMLAALREEAARGASVVLATHDPDAAAQTDAALALDEGVATWVRRP
jgi:putative ABC transport system ATP-binding protein